MGNPPHQPDILIVVPARGGSKRLPGKNLRMLGGIPLIAHTARFLAEEGLLEAAIVSTDDAAIAETAGQYGLRAPFRRPAELATDSATTASVVRHALDWRVANDGSAPDLVAVLQVTSPFRRAGQLREAIALLADAPAANSAVSMHRLHVPANYVFTMRPWLEAASTATDPAYVPTGSIYVTRTSAFDASNSLYNAPIGMIEMNAIEALDIDEMDDLLFAEFLLRTRQNGRRAHAELAVGLPPSPVSGRPADLEAAEAEAQQSS